MAEATGRGSTPDEDIPIFVDTGVPAPRESDSLWDDVRARGNGAERVGTVVRDAYGEALDLAERCARQAAARFQSLGRAVRPEEVELQLAIRVEAGGTVGLAKSTAEAQLQLTFRWAPGRTAPALTEAEAREERTAPPPAAAS
ncbi:MULTISPECIES: CU044_2847 family protein [unclassified Streptomyces]|uniref:CU044_2847 family protein n=1 Tax=unclassified Streptomyces TaxID=2593676 RepID=UPI003D0807AB